MNTTPGGVESGDVMTALHCRRRLEGDAGHGGEPGEQPGGAGGVESGVVESDDGVALQTETGR